MLPSASSVQKLPRIATSPSCKFEPDAGRLQRAAADQVLQRVVAEQAEVARAAAGADAGAHRNAAAQDAGLGQRVEVGRVGRFQLGPTARLLRQAAQAVGHVHDDLGVVFDVQLARKSVEVHGGRGRRSEVRGQGFIVAKYGWAARGVVRPVADRYGDEMISVGGHAEFPVNGLPQSSGLAAGAK